MINYIGDKAHGIAQKLVTHAAAHGATPNRVNAHVTPQPTAHAAQVTGPADALIANKDKISNIATDPIFYSTVDLVFSF